MMAEQRDAGAGSGFCHVEAASRLDVRPAHRDAAGGRCLCFGANTLSVFRPGPPAFTPFLPDARHANLRGRRAARLTFGCTWPGRHAAMAETAPGGHQAL